MCVFFFSELDTEFRYWSFMEAHPAHNSLPAKAKLEAMDVLTWAWTGNRFFFYLFAPLCSLFFSSIERLLPSHRAVPAPFTQEECQELMTLIRSFGGTYHTSLLLQQIYLFMRRQMTVMTTESKHALFLGFSSELVSRTLLFFHIFTLAY